MNKEYNLWRRDPIKFIEYWMNAECDYADDGKVVEWMKKNFEEALSRCLIDHELTTADLTRQLDRVLKTGKIG
jgi:hypothetical protein